MNPQQQAALVSLGLIALLFAGATLWVRRDPLG